MKSWHDPNSTESRLAEGLARLAAVAREAEWRQADKAGLTPTQADILRLLAGRPGGLRVTDAALHLGVRKATASEAASALVRKLLLEKRAEPGDGRASRLVATEPGRRVAAAWTDGFAGVVAMTPEAARPMLLEIVVGTIRALQTQGLIPPQRICLTCRHLRENAEPGDGGPFFCAFVGAPFGAESLQTDCPDHLAAA